MLDQAQFIYNLNFRLQKEEQKRPKTFIERLAEERDAKRRRVSKKVHTNRKSYTEVCIDSCGIFGVPFKAVGLLGHPEMYK